MEQRKRKYINEIHFIIIFNVVILITWLFVIDITISHHLSDNAQQSLPQEVILPTVTLTNEVKAEVLWDKMRIDTSTINQKAILESISPWEPYIVFYAKKYSVDPNLVRAIIYVESKGDPSLVSMNGAVGLMQLMPSTAEFLGIQDILNPEKNIEAGVKYLSWLVRNYDETRMLWAWNAGIGMLENDHMPRETKAFIVHVLSIKASLDYESDGTI
jgi:hypothetical protein